MVPVFRDKNCSNWKEVVVYKFQIQQHAILVYLHMYYCIRWNEKKLLKKRAETLETLNILLTSVKIFNDYFIVTTQSYKDDQLRSSWINSTVLCV